LLLCYLVEAFRATAAAISKEFGITLFGFDAIIPCQDYVATSCSSSSSRSSRSSSNSSSSHINNSGSNSNVCSKGRNGGSGDRDCDRTITAAVDSTAELPPPKQQQQQQQQQQQVPHLPVVIDVNYFPSFKEVKDFPARLKTFLRSKMKNSVTIIPISTTSYS
jgi:hypothetical protein